MEGWVAMCQALRRRLPPFAVDDVIVEEQALDICSAPKAEVETAQAAPEAPHLAAGQLEAIVPVQDTVKIGDMSALTAFMAQMCWRASGLYLMVRPQAELLGSHWIGLGIDKLTCCVEDLTYYVQFSHGHITVGTYTDGKMLKERVRRAQEQTAWKECLGHTHLLLDEPFKWQAGRLIVWNLRLEQAVAGSLGISHLVRELDGVFKSLGYVHEARNMLYEWGPTWHLSAYDTLLFQCRRRAAAA